MATTGFSANEERVNKKKAILYLLGSLLAIILFVIFGLPGLAKLSSFVGSFKRNNEPISKEDITPPMPPTLDDLPEYTNQKNLTITGVSESGATLTLYLNDNPETLIADNTGRFSYTTELSRGINTINISVKDTNNNQSNSTLKKEVVYDDLAPDLEIISPADGSSFYGNLQRQIVIEGKTEENVSIKINDRVIVVENNGSFSFATTLVEGENSFTIKATDKAGNETQKGITFHYWK